MDFKQILEERNKKNAKMNKILAILGIILIPLIAFASYKIDKYKTGVYLRQLDEIKQLQLQMDQIQKDQIFLEGAIIQIQQQVKENLEIQAKNTGKASYYDYQLNDGWSSKGHRVCASRTFKRGSTLRVTNLENNKYVDCLVTDYGPDGSIFPDRVVDLSSHAFSQIAPLGRGVVSVTIKEIKQ